MAGATRAKVQARYDGESVEAMLNRLKRKVEKENIMTDFYKHQEYIQPSQLKKRARAAAKKREKRRLAESMSTRPMV